jgi:hypothetical protein
MKQDMKNEIGDPLYRDWEAYSRKLDKDIEARRKKLDETIKLIVEFDPGQREVLRKEIVQLRFEFLNLVLKQYGNHSDDCL